MKLEIYMKEQGLTDEVFGLGIKVNPMTVYRYRKGKILPSKNSLEKIFKFTKGLVTPNDFYELTKS